MLFFSSHDFNDLPLSTHILFGLRLDSSNIFGKTLVAVIPFLSFKGITLGYLLKILITHKKRYSFFKIYLLIAYQQGQHPKYYL